MEWTTHALSGVAVGYVATGDWKYALVSGVVALLPDLDEPKSKFGKTFFFISLPVNKMFGHRTFTHSLLFVAIAGTSGLIFSPLVGYAAALGLLTHIVGDMLTGKVQLLYPINKSYGIKVSRFNYLVIDRVTKFFILLFMVYIAYKDILQNFL